MTIFFRSWNNSRASIIKLKDLYSFFFLFFISVFSYGQCAMCRAALEGEGNQSQAAAVNDGIVYLMVIPYLLVAAVGYYVYRMKKKKQ